MCCSSKRCCFYTPPETFQVRLPHGKTFGDCWIILIYRRALAVTLAPMTVSYSVKGIKLQRALFCGNFLPAQNEICRKHPSVCSRQQGVHRNDQTVPPVVCNQQSPHTVCMQQPHICIPSTRCECFMVRATLHVLPCLFLLIITNTSSLNV